MTVTSDAPARGSAGDGGDGDPARPSGARGRAARLGTAGVVVTLAVGVGLRFWTTSDLWLDEALTVNIADLAVGDIPDALRRDGAPPVYYFLLHGWIQLFGTGDLAVRALSGLAACAALPLAWQAGRRIGGLTTAWAAVLILASNPFAIRYATETRMYSLLVLLVFAGILALRRAYERPDLARLAVLALVVALVTLTHYWSLYLVASVLALLVGLARFGRRPEAARRLVVAVAAGGVPFVAWLPVFVDQMRHTGTPWGTPVLPPLPIGLTFLDFAGRSEHEGWLLLFPMAGLVALGLLGRSIDGRHIELDLRTRPAARWEAVVGGSTLLLGTSAAFVLGSAYQTRYAAVVLPFYVLLAAHGVASFSSPRVRAAVLAVVIVLGIAGGVRSVFESRTQAGAVADVLTADAGPDDVVVYCPDQLGPATSRLAPGALEQLTYPDLTSPRFVDWVDYEDRLAAADVATVAREVREQTAGTIWLVRASGYRTHEGTCEALEDALAGDDRSRSTRVSQGDALEGATLVELRAP